VFNFGERGNTDGKTCVSGIDRTSFNVGVPIMISEYAEAATSHTYGDESTNPRHARSFQGEPSADG
jgi:hypothetical protein